jgi:hypothetical protein
VNTALRAQLKSIAAVAANVSEVFVPPVPEGATGTYITIQRVDGQRRMTLDGLTGVAVDIWQVDIYAVSDTIGETVRDAVIAALGSVGPATWTATEVHSCRLDDSRDFEQGEQAARAERVNRKSLDFAIVYEV